MYALYAETGQLLWKHYTGLTLVSTPVQKNQYLYFASARRLYSLKVKTGESVLTYSTQTDPGKFVIDKVAAPILDSSFIYFKTNDGSLLALDLKFRLKWKKKLSESYRDFTSASSGLAIGPVCLYTSSLQDGLYCLNKKTGRTIWKNSTGSHGDILLLGSLLFYPSQDGRILALDQKSGKQIWSHQVLIR